MEFLDSNIVYEPLTSDYPCTTSFVDTPWKTLSADYYCSLYVDS